MKRAMNIYTSRRLPIRLAVAAVLPLLLCSCLEQNSKKPDAPKAEAASEMPQQHRTIIAPSLLPDRFRQAGYMISEERSADKKEKDGGAADLEALQLKVGSSITTTQPIPLREAMKAIVRTKNMSLSWAPDVDQELLVDIDVRANENFYEAIDNILRQLDYFQELDGSTLVIKYRETKKYQIAMPFIKQEYVSSNGVKSLDSSATLGSSGNKFDIWENIRQNIDSLIKTWSAGVVTPDTASPEDQNAPAAAEKDKKKKNGKVEEKTADEVAAPALLSRRVSSSDSSYTIDKPVGLITVHAPRSLQKKISDYLVTLEKELYKQIVIEAKIIEVQLDDSSSLGINWHQLLDNLRLISNSTLNRKSDYTKKVTDESSQKVTGESSQKYSSSSEYLNRKTTTKTELTVEDLTATADSASNSTDAITSDSGSMIKGLKEDRNFFADENVEANVSDSWNMGSAGAAAMGSIGATAATVITNGTNISESLAAGAELITNFSFPSFIKALQVQGQASILSNPKISVMNGQPALISVGKNVTYISKIDVTVDAEKGTRTYTSSTDKVLSGIGLALSAVVKRDNEIVMNLVPITSELTEPIEYRVIGEGSVGLPIVNMREMSTTVKIKDGSMLVVGGLISDREIKDGENFLPGTKDIPYLKYLFGYETKKKIKRELIILLRPRIIN